MRDAELLPNLKGKLDPDLVKALGDKEKPWPELGRGLVTAFVGMVFLFSVAYGVLVIGNGRTILGVSIDGSAADQLLSAFVQVMGFMVGIVGTIVGFSLGMRRGARD